MIFYSNTNLTIVEKNFGGGAIFVLKIGEEGRGRSYNLIPCYQGIKAGDLVSPIINEQWVIKSIIPSEIPEGKYLAVLSSEGAYIRGADGYILKPEGADEVRVLARGCGAYGDAGRLGGWDEILAIVPEGTLLKIKKTRGGSYFLWFATDQKVYRIEPEELPLATHIPEVQNWVKI